MYSIDHFPSTPSLSVVLPTYQRCDSVLGAVESALAQTHEDFELIVVDDGSTDGTGEALAGLDPRVRYSWQENRGVAAACNAGVRLSRAPLIAFLHSDDRWLPDHLAAIAEGSARHPEAVLLCTRPRFLATGRERGRKARVLDALPLLLVENFVGHPSSVAVRKAAFAAAGGFDEELIVSEGRELWLRLAMRGPFCLLERRTVALNETPGSLTDVGRRSGSHVPADELMAERVAAEVAKLERPDSRELVARARGRVEYAAALRGLVSHDEAAVATALREACRLLPELSREAYLVERRIHIIGRDRSERLAHLATAAALWPEPRSDTALYLRAKAVILALRLGRPRTVVSLAARWPLAATPRFFAHTLPVWIRLIRRTLDGWRHAGRETTYV